VITLENEVWRVGVVPEAGASLTFGQIAGDGVWHDLLRPTPAALTGVPDECSSYVLVPWSNRVRDGVLRFRGQEYRLRVNCPDGTAIHGTAKDFPWTVRAADATTVTMTYRSADFVGVSFPWRFSAEVSYRLDGPRLVIETAVRNDDEVPFPAGFGHHPYFRRTLTGPTDEALLEVPCEEHLPLDACLPAGRPVPVPPVVDFRRLRPLGDAHVDDCLVGWDPSRPIRLRYPVSGRELTMVADGPYHTVVVYVPTGKPFFAVEPVTNANDGFNLLEAGLAESGLVVLEPGEELTASATLAVVA